ncbi:solute carrier organic anion transporter family member 1B3 [Cavia porcellus]|uniref:Solute carrier organic anion transporter family member n=1 Tax=Cavia porcellus TaxID=10141 RepID=H0W6D9_CAVPO|nr:solute carrier organic anion transporter family member 1B3 [Cavia porcellus]XP_013008621.1 solute carrier organic anion transporter family member 1B3 [Cavia porcellus]
MDESQHLNKPTEAKTSEQKKAKCCDSLKMFLAALSFSVFCRLISGISMKTAITHIERRFDLPSSVAGFIDGGFEMGNLLVIVFVSYFGSKLHRPKIIGIGCVIMGTGSILTALPHFFMGYYRYSIETHINTTENIIATCSANQTTALTPSPEIAEKGCEKESESYMWIYVLMGNMLRGIGETPIAPLGISYIDDFAKEQSSVYLGILQTVSVLGIIFAFLIGAVFTKMYVDTGYVDLSTIRITSEDSRWVGAWWLGFLIAGVLSFIASLPFFSLPRNPTEPQEERKVSKDLHEFKISGEQKQTHHRQRSALSVTGFLQSMKYLLTNHLYVIFVLLTLVVFSSHVGSFTHLFKYIEQQYGYSISQANLLGALTIPIMAIGTLLGGYLIKKLKMTLIGIAKFSFFVSLMGFICHLSFFLVMCDRKSVAGLTLGYDGISPLTSQTNATLSYCNLDCNCDESQWEPICGDNGMTYLSPCLAGCTSRGSSENSTMFYNCSCLEISGFKSKNYSAHLGECPRDNHCKMKLYIFGSVQALDAFFVSLGSVTYIMLLVKNVLPELKSLAMGFHSLIMRGIGGLLAPIYFGTMIDRTCMKWSTTGCGARGACRIYDSKSFGTTLLGLAGILKFLALILYIVLIYAMKKKYEGKDFKALEKEGNIKDEAKLEFLSSNGHSAPSRSVYNDTNI